MGDPKRMVDDISDKPLDEMDIEDDEAWEEEEEGEEWDDQDEWEDEEEWEDDEDEGEDAAVLPADYRSGFVAVVGRPNVGKSTLVNAYVGQKVAIVSNKPQTTRRRILGVRTDNTAQIVFVDTPGIHKPHHRLGQFMVDEAAQAIPDADVILYVVDVADKLGEDDTAIAEMIRQRTEAPVVLALNKADVVNPKYLQENYDAYLGLVPGATEMLVSAKRGDNLDKLLELVVQRLPEGPQYYPGDQVTDQTEQVLSAELVREAVLHLTEAEVPHSVAVAIEDWEERGPNLTYIGAVVYVERDSQKAIVIGKRGSMLREIGKRARAEIEALLERKVYLDLFIKVREGWRRSPAQLRRLGFTSEE